MGGSLERGTIKEKVEYVCSVFVLVEGDELAFLFFCLFIFKFLPLIIIRSGHTISH